ncbi:MAG: LamG domain-containing protein, partial [Planctomycetaceae bacterium]|nr:LamG domain-containing protein [Planctomycetaceae bacterium]
MKYQLLFLVGLLAVVLAKPTATAQDPVGVSAKEVRVTKGLQVLYDFRVSSGPLIKDYSGNGKPIDLRIGNLQGVRRSPGGLEVRGPAAIQSAQPAGSLATIFRRSGAITVEAWVRPANTKQEGPSRILTFSSNSSNRNLTLGQEGNRFDVRLRTTRTTKNGFPSVDSPQRSLAPSRMHVVYPRSRRGQARIFLDG